MSVCTVCSDERAREINHLLLKGGMVRKVAAKFKLSEQVLARHRRRHLNLGPRSQPADTFEGKLAALQQDARRLQLEAEVGGTKNVSAALAVLRERRMLIELEGKLTGKLADGGAPTTHVTVNAGNAAQPPQPTPTPEEMLRLAKEYIEDYEREHALYPGEIVPNAKPTE